MAADPAVLVDRDAQDRAAAAPISRLPGGCARSPGAGGSVAEGVDVGARDVGEDRPPCLVVGARAAARTACGSRAAAWRSRRPTWSCRTAHRLAERLDAADVVERELARRGRAGPPSGRPRPRRRQRRHEAAEVLDEVEAGPRGCAGSRPRRRTRRRSAARAAAAWSARPTTGARPGRARAEAQPAVLGEDPRAILVVVVGEAVLGPPQAHVVHGQRGETSGMRDCSKRVGGDAGQVGQQPQDRSCRPDFGTGRNRTFSSGEHDGALARRGGRSGGCHRREPLRPGARGVVDQSRGQRRRSRWPRPAVDFSGRANRCHRIPRSSSPAPAAAAPACSPGCCSGSATTCRSPRCRPTTRTPRASPSPSGSSTSTRSCCARAQVQVSDARRRRGRRRAGRRSTRRSRRAARWLARPVRRRDRLIVKDPRLSGSCRCGAGAPRASASRRGSSRCCATRPRSSPPSSAGTAAGRARPRAAPAG